MRRTLCGSRAVPAVMFGLTLSLYVTQSAFPAEGWASSYALSPSQKRYVKTYGYPEQFILLLVSEEVDFRKVVKRVLPKPRRLETWLYLTRERYVTFDNGYFAEEVATGVPIDDPEMLPPTDLNPTQFTAGLTRADLTARYGRPDNVESVKLGKHLVEVYRYLAPSKGVKSFTFFDQRLQSVIAGFAFITQEKTPEIRQ